MSRKIAIETRSRLRRFVEFADDLGPTRGRALEGFFGVVLPVIAIGIEVSTGGVHAYGYFDPLSSPLYVLSSALVPATVGWGRRARGTKRRALVQSRWRSASRS